MLHCTPWDDDPGKDSTLLIAFITIVLRYTKVYWKSLLPSICILSQVCSTSNNGNKCDIFML